MIYDVIIVGAGIAGMTAGIYAKRAGKSVLVLEKKAAGGQILATHLVKNYPGYLEISGADLMKNVCEQMTSLGVELRYEEVTKIETEKVREIVGKVVTVAKELPYKVVKTEENEYQAKTVIIATGRAEAKLGVKGEDLAGVSYCATCDGELYTGKTVAVLGGGNTALYEALYLADIAEKVYVVHRREKFRGDAKLVDDLSQHENVEFVMGMQIDELAGKDKVERVKMKKLGKWIMDPENEKIEKREIEVDGVFIAVGQAPQTSFVLEDDVDLDENGYIVAGEDCHTSYPGIYVAGDCRTKELRQLVTAAADGARAASEMVKEMGE